MRSRSWLIATALSALGGGCDLVFGVDPGQIDTDLDGVPDVFDNCVLAANARQLDEDGDAVGDTCDNCVGLPNHSQDDLGESPLAGDGIGDWCDPHPSELGDFVVGRYFIEGGDDPADWVSVTGTWMVDGDAARAIDPESPLATLRYPVQLTAGAVLDVGIAVTATGAMAPGEHQAAGIWIDVDAAEPRGRLCEVRRELEAPTVLAMADAVPTAQQVIYATEYPDAIEATDSALVVRRLPSVEGAVTYSCYDPLITGEPLNWFHIDGTVADAGVGYLGLYATNAAVQFRYVVIYDR